MDTQRGVVSILSARHTVMEYDYQGNYKGKKDISCHADKMESITLPVLMKDVVASL